MPTVHADAGRSSALNDPVFTLCLHCTSPLQEERGSGGNWKGEWEGKKKETEGTNGRGAESGSWSLKRA